MRDLAPVHVGAAVLHRAEPPRLDGLGQAAEVPRVGDGDPRPLRAPERHPLAEQALVVLERQVADAQVAAEPHARGDLDDVRVDVLAAEGLGHRHAVVAVADEEQVADLVQRDRRQRLPAPLGGGDPLPARAQPRRGRPEAAVEVGGAVDGADDRVQRHDLEPAVLAPDHAEGVDDLLEREDQPDVVGLAPQPPADVGEQACAAGAREVALSVGCGEPGGHALIMRRGSVVL